MENDKLLDKLVINEIKTQSDYLADKIKNMIVSREFHDGFVFPNENEFCKKLNVSRSTLRKHIRFSIHKGLYTGPSTEPT